MSRWTVFVMLVRLAAGLVGCDHASKHIAETHLLGRPSVELVPGVLDFTLARNHDVGFSLLRAVPAAVKTPLIVLASGLATVLIAVAWARRRTAPWFDQLG